jgi:hypothetical protein
VLIPLQHFELAVAAKDKASANGDQRRVTDCQKEVAFAVEVFQTVSNASYQSGSGSG